MIHLTKGNTTAVYFTARESASISDPRFLFVFTGPDESVVKFNVANESADDRFDFCTVIVDNYFSGKIEGLWTYEIRQKSDSTTTVDGAILEEGYMMLKPAAEFTMNEYTEQSNTYKVYNGQ